MHASINVIDVYAFSLTNKTRCDFFELNALRLGQRSETGVLTECTTKVQIGKCCLTSFRAFNAATSIQQRVIYRDGQSSLLKMDFDFKIENTILLSIFKYFWKVFC